MSDHSNISAEMQTRIMAELAQVERENGVEIVLAVESGSRAWGFPSLDSDYDVRFLFLRPRSVYLSVFTPAEVIDHALDAVFDVNGWDLRKALRMMTVSNATLLEWLTSPIRYRADGALVEELLQVYRAGVSLPNLAYHYDRLARRSLGEIGAAAHAVRLKTYCYALRAALALVWIRECGTPPPMDLPSLLAGVSCPPDARQVIDALVRDKAVATEKDTTARLKPLDALLAGILDKPETRPEPEERRVHRARLDRLFETIVTGRA
jgi:predicted nucleotidyltransferase